MSDIIQLEAEVEKLKKALNTLTTSGAQVSTAQLDILRKTISQKEAELNNLKQPEQKPEGIEVAPPPPPLEATPKAIPAINEPNAAESNTSFSHPQASNKHANTQLKHKAVDEPKLEASGQTETKIAVTEEVQDIVIVEITRSKHDEIVKDYRKNYADIMEPDQLQKMINNALVANTSGDQDKIKRVAEGAKVKIVFLEERPKEEKREESVKVSDEQSNEQKKPKSTAPKVDPFKYTKVFLDKTPQGGTEFLDSQVRGEKGMAALAAKSQIAYETLVSNPAHNVTTAKAIAEAPRATPTTGAGQEISTGRK